MNIDQMSFSARSANEGNVADRVRRLLPMVKR
jgi:hypothetical protein